MWKTLLARFRQGHRTLRFPHEMPAMPDRLRGAPVIDPAKCVDGCRVCADACPTDAIAITDRPRIDLGRCLFCTACSDACPEGAIRYGLDPRISARSRRDLVVEGEAVVRAAALGEQLRRLLGRSLKLRQVSAGGCNGCEADTNVLTTIGWDMGRFGIDFVASPRHADGVLITGAVSGAMELALRKTWDAVPAPKSAIAVGACAISGGPYLGHPEVRNGADAIVPIDLYVPGCPPHPVAILDGLLRLIGRIEGAAPTAVDV
jgi:Ni,Fe-hydrogenase III small subunit/NAD-dependent dihydropyrimidine dehydrogenase PreA subunit